MSARPAIFLLTLIAGCGSDGERVSADDLGRLQSQQGPPLYWVGESFEGLPLTHVEASVGRALIVYGTCEPPGSTDGGCAPPMEIQQTPFHSVPWPLVRGCGRLAALRGVPTVRLDGRVLFTGETMVKIYAASSDQERRVALALRPVTRSAPLTAPLPRPTAEFEPIIDEACGARPGERGPPIG